MNQLRKIIGLMLAMLLVLCACDNNTIPNNSLDERVPDDPIQESPKGRLSNPYTKDETVEITTEERSWNNIVTGTTTTYGAAQLKISIVEDMFFVSGTVSNGNGNVMDDSCVLLGICIEAVSIPDDVDYITFSDYIKSLHFLTSDKSEVTPVFYWLASYNAYSDIYTEAKSGGHIHFDYYVDIDYAMQNLYEGGKLYLLIGGLCSTDFTVSSADDLDYLVITYYDEDSSPITVYQSIK